MVRGNTPPNPALVGRGEEEGRIVGREMNGCIKLGGWESGRKDR